MRLALESDFDAVYAIHMDEAVIPFLGIEPLGPDEFRPVFAALVASGNFYVVEAEGVVAGFYKITRFEGRAAHVAQLGTLAVAPRFQGSGIARRMVAGAVAALTAACVRRIELIVESDNPRGVAFYQRMGFEIEGRLRMFYKRAHQDHYVDDFMMSLVVPSGPNDERIAADS